MGSNPPEIRTTLHDANAMNVEAPRLQDDFATGQVSNSQQHFEELFDRVDRACPSFIESCFGEDQNAIERRRIPGQIGSFLLQMTRPGPLRDSLDLAIVNDGEWTDVESSLTESQKKSKEFMEREKRAQMAYRIHKNRFPTQIWHCCSQVCFATIATDPLQYMVFDELILIHEYAEGCHAAAENLPGLIEGRRRGIGTSTVAFVAPSRGEMEAASGGQHGTEREKALRKFGTFVVEVLPFLYGQVDSPRGTTRPKKKLCTQAICCILGVSRNFLYNRTCAFNPANASEEELTSLIDTAGLRLRQLRRMGCRGSYPPLQSLQEYACGCDMPCFSGVPQWTIVSEYNEFIKLAKELRPRHKENRFLLNRMFCPLTNTTIRVCNRAVSALYTVSESLVADIRLVLNTMCSDPSLQDRPLLNDGSARYRYDRTQPLNRYPKSIRNYVEGHLDMVLRADPAGSSGESVCRVYSPEINTEEKLRQVLRKALSDHDTIDANLSSSTLQRMFKEYLQRRNYSTISFTQSDHNACPNCKTLHYAVLQFHHEFVYMKHEADELSRRRPLLESDQMRHDSLLEAIDAKRFQEEECIRELNVHNSRDRRIREVVKSLTDHFRDVENRYLHMLSSQSYSDGSADWNLFPDRACMTHQDDMSKLDLPHFVVSASSDITRWRFDVNAHVSSFTKDAVVLSHEQGTGAKNSSAIIEELILDHLLRCQGESIKIIVSDNAAVGKSWLTTVALPQYLVDQRLADVVLIIFLENNHGKWLCDMLFGQFQSRRRREVLFSIDDMLNGFEDIKKKSGKVQGFAVNPLCSIEFSEVFESLGYQTKPPSELGFVKRNIHFAGACAAGTKQRLPVHLRELLGDALPDDPGMVRLSTEPSSGPPQCQRRYEDCYFDVPAARLPTSSRGISATEYVEMPMTRTRLESDDPSYAPLVVPLDAPYSTSGNGVVSTRTAEHVGYNGIAFRRLNACPEMRNTSKALVRRAWPRGLLEPPVGGAVSDEPVATAESIKCAPLNWIVRRPVRYFCSSDDDWIARYPPQNLLNARYRKGPRVTEPWVPTATYEEPPFPIIEGTAACSAMKKLASEHSDITGTIHVLDALKAVYEEMGDRDGVSDYWLQRNVTMPSSRAVNRYREEMRIHVERESGHPSAPKTVRQLFKEDNDIQAQVAQILGNRSVSRAAERTLKTQTLTKLFQEAESTPGAFDRFYHLVEKDQERYARELRDFKKKQEQYDRDHGLQPQQ